MSAKKLILEDRYLVFFICEFLDEKSSFRYFNTNKYNQYLINKYPEKFYIKKHIYANENYNKLLKYNIEYLIVSDEKFLHNLPRNLKILNLTCNVPIRDLPESIIKLQFSYEFNQSVDNLPKNLKHLSLSVEFNKLVNHLPENLIHLSFGYSFNQPIDYLPKNLKYLRFGFKFNQHIDHLPDSIEFIQFGYCFNQPVDNLPKNIKKIIFGKKFLFPLDNLPESVKEIDLDFNYKRFGPSLEALISRNIKINFFNFA